MNTRELGILGLLCFVWGLHFVVIKLAVTAAPPMFYAALRLTLVSIVLAPFLRWRPGQMRRVIVAAFCMGAFNYALMFSGIKYATASAAAIAIELYVPFATILSIIFLDDKLGWRRALGILLAFAGVAVIALSNNNEASAATHIGLGVGLVAAGAFSEAIGAILIKQSRTFKPHELLAWFSIIGMVALWGLTFTFETGQGEAWATVDRTMLTGAILYSALGASVFGHSAYYWLLQRLPVSVVAPSVLLTTVIAVFFSVLLLGDHFGTEMIVGGLMTLAGVGVVLLRNVKKQANIVIAAEPPG